MMKNCIYKIESKINGRIYIGSAKNIISRKSLHKRTLANGNHHNIKLQNHYNKYGKDDLFIEVLESNLSIEKLIEREQYFIDKINPFFNICKRAGSSIGRIHSDETKKK